MKALDVIAATAPPWAVGDLRAGGGHWRGTVDAPRPNGSPASFEVVIDQHYGVIGVQEAGPSPQLPPHCLERHILRDGRFCLGYRDDSVSRPETRAQAHLFWKKLRGFLELQHLATALKRWPEAFAWPHSAAAAETLAYVEGLVQSPEQITEGRRASQPLRRGRNLILDRPHNTTSFHDVLTCRLLAGQPPLLGALDLIDAVARAHTHHAVCCGDLPECSLRVSR